MISARLRQITAATLLGSVALLAGCSQEPAESGDANADADFASVDHSGHVHTAPHGGTLVALGDHVGNAEVQLDAETGTLTVWLLDGCAEKPVRVADPSLSMIVVPHSSEGDGEEMVFALGAVANELTGEEVGNTSQFSLQSDRLMGIEEFHGQLVSVQMLGQMISPTSFDYPGSSEHTIGGHDHDHGDDHGHDHDDHDHGHSDEALHPGS